MHIDGNTLADEWAEELRLKRAHIQREIILGIVIQGDHPAIRSFVEKKKMRATQLGITVVEERVPLDAPEEEVLRMVKKLSEKCDGVIVQLPLSPAVDTERVLNSVPPEKDVDMLSLSARMRYEAGDMSRVPAVVSAIRYVTKRHGIEIVGKRVLVVGNGRLVGRPASFWLKTMGASVSVCTKEDSKEALTERAQNADILVLGAGVPGILTPSMIREGCSIFDAGSSEEAGVLKGDADPLCAEKASLFTPVPGGIGPLTVVALFENLINRTA